MLWTMMAPSGEPPQPLLASARRPLSDKESIRGEDSLPPSTAMTAPPHCTIAPGTLIGSPSLSSPTSTDDRQGDTYYRAAHIGDGGPSPTQHHRKFATLPSYIARLDEKGASHEQQLQPQLHSHHHSSTIPASRQHHDFARGGPARPVRAEPIVQQYHRSPAPQFPHHGGHLQAQTRQHQHPAPASRTSSVDTLSARHGGRVQSNWQQFPSPAVEANSVRDMATNRNFGAPDSGELASSLPREVIYNRSSRAWSTGHPPELRTSLLVRRPYGGETGAIADGIDRKWAPWAPENDRSVLADSPGQRRPCGTASDDKDRSPRDGARYSEAISSKGGHAEGRYSFSGSRSAAAGLDAPLPFSVEAMTRSDADDPARKPVYSFHSAAGSHVPLYSNSAYSYIPGRPHAHTSIQRPVDSDGHAHVADKQHGPRRPSSYQPYPDWGERAAYRPHAVQPVESRGADHGYASRGAHLAMPSSLEQPYFSAVGRGGDVLLGRRGHRDAHPGQPPLSGSVSHFSPYAPPAGGLQRSPPSMVQYPRGHMGGQLHGHAHPRRASISSDESSQYTTSSQPHAHADTPGAHRPKVPGKRADGNSRKTERKKYKRTVLTDHQLKYLKGSYEKNPSPLASDMEKISADLGLETRVIRVFFQNRRARNPPPVAS